MFRLFQMKSHIISLKTSLIAAQQHVTPYVKSNVQQQRFMGGRNVGQSQWNQPRPPTPKQRKAYRRKKRKDHFEQVGKHSPPGSKAKDRQQFATDMMDVAKLEASGKLLPLDQDPSITYNYGHAMVEDLMGNSAHLSSTPTPKIKNYAKYYLPQLEKIQTQEQLEDSEVSFLVRAYRDHLRQEEESPLSIAHVLQTLTNSWGISLSSVGEQTYTSIMTCAAHPAEARLILNKMKLNQLPLTYAYSILVHLHARRGEYREAREILDELIATPHLGSSTEQSSFLPAYTSLIAACFKAITMDNTTPRSIKSDAATVAWEAWKEMRIVGIHPDVMAYGAIIRLFAARGQPERCINLIEEMSSLHKVLPTTLVFTSALHAVAKSHSIALRFEGGSHKKNKKRQHIAAHHGKMARQILIMAENAEVEQDDGFVSALISCAASAGDCATAKAIYLASDIRRKDHLRTIGSNVHLKTLQPPPGHEINDIMVLSDNSASSLSLEHSNSSSSSLFDNNQKNMHMVAKGAYLGDDDDDGIPPQVKDEGRKYRSLLLAFSQSIESKGIGDLWGGTQNKGFLCDRTQAAIVTRQVPEYRDNSIPGMTGTDVALGSMEWEDEPDRIGKQLSLPKFAGLSQDLDAGSTMDDIDPELAAMFHEEEEEDKMTPLALGQSGNYDDLNDERHLLGNSTPSFENTLSAKTTDTTIQSDLDGIYLEEVTSVVNESGSLSALTVSENKDSFVDENIYSLTKRVDEEDEYELDEFEKAMPPGLPQPRIDKLRKAFESNLAEPSMLELIPILRENMPEDAGLHWLQKKNLQNAYFVMEKAEEEGLVDTRLMNNMLKVIANANFIGKALSYHEVQYQLRGLEPDSLSDRVIIEMLVRNKRLSRALEFKEKVIEQQHGRYLDLHGYGSLVEYYGKHHQLGSALLILKECIDVHGYPPNESALSKIRLMCRQRNLEQEVNLEAMIGKDPLAWLRHGEANLKREMSRKGRRQVVAIRNKTLQRL